MLVFYKSFLPYAVDNYQNVTVTSFFVVIIALIIHIIYVARSKTIFMFISFLIYLFINCIAVNRQSVKL